VIVGYRALATEGGGNDGLGALLAQGRSEAVGIIGAVGDELRERAGASEHSWCHADIGNVAWAQEQDRGPASRVGQRVDLGVPPTARASDRLPKGPPFPPPAERCALMCVLSIAIGPVM
jgi:hypothetical protein